MKYSNGASGTMETSSSKIDLRDLAVSWVPLHLRTDVAIALTEALQNIYKHNPSGFRRVTVLYLETRRFMTFVIDSPTHGRSKRKIMKALRCVRKAKPDPAKMADCGYGLSLMCSLASVSLRGSKLFLRFRKRKATCRRRT